MNNSKLDLAFRIILTTMLFVVPIGLAAIIWFTPALETNLFLVGISTVNVILSLAEVLFLVRAVIFPKSRKKWWQDW